MAIGKSVALTANNAILAATLITLLTNLCNMGAWAWFPVKCFTGGDEAKAMQAS